MKYTPEMIANVRSAHSKGADADKLLLQLLKHPDTSPEMLASAREIALSIAKMLKELPTVADAVSLSKR